MICTHDLYDGADARGRGIGSYATVWRCRALIGTIVLAMAGDGVVGAERREAGSQGGSNQDALFVEYGGAGGSVDSNHGGPAEPLSSRTNFDEGGLGVPLQGSAENPARLVQIDVDRLEALKGKVDEGRRSSVVLNLEPGHEWPAVFERAVPTDRGYSLSGHLADDALSSVTFVVNGNLVSGMVSSVHGTWTIRNRGGATYEVVRARGERRCSVQSAVGSRPTNGEAGQQRAAAAEEDDGNEIDVLVLFTPAARQWAGGLDEMRALVDLWMAATNEAYLAGAAVQRIVLAGAVEVDYVESDEPGGNRIDLRRLEAPDDGFMDEIHDLRDGYAADIVHLIVDHPLWGTGGIANFPLIFGDDGAASLDWDGRFGFSVSEVEDVPRTFAHELGHVMGLNHDRYQMLHGGTVWNLPFPHSYGYVNQRAFEDEAPHTSRWLTIMAYEFQCFHQGDFDCVRPMRFSNPSQVYPEGAGDPMGVGGEEPSDAVGGPSDAVRTLDATRSIVGNYRQRADACRVTLSETVRTVDESGASLFVEVQGEEGCSWRAWTPNGDFISVDETAGNGGESVTIRIEPNDGFARIGYVYVAAEGFVVRQRGIHAVADVCERTPAVATALANQSGREDCAAVTEFDLLLIAELDLDIWDDDRPASPSRPTKFIPGRERLNGLRANDFEGLSQLRRLSLVGHGLDKFGNPMPGMGIASLPEGVFDHLVELEQLNLTSSGVTTIGPAFGETRKLRTLSLATNGLGHVPLGIFDGLTELRWLSLQNNGLTTLPEGVFRDLSRLHSLHLGGNGFNAVPRALRSGLGELTLLELSFNPLQHLPDNAFAGLPKVDFIALWGADLSSIAPNAFADVSGLRNLDLRYNGLTELSTRIPGANISNIWLTNNRVATLGDGVFAGFTSEYCNGSATSLLLDLRENPGAPFDLVVELDRVDGGDAAASPARMVAKVREGAPWPLTVVVAAGNDSLDTQTVTIANGELQSEPFEVEDAGSVTLRIDSVDELPSSYKGIKAVAGEPLALFSMKDETLKVGGRPLAVDLDAVLAKDGVAWGYVAVSSDDGVATARVDGTTLFVDPKGVGTTTVTVTATTEDGSQTVRSFEVRVSSPTLLEVAYMPSATGTSRQGFVRVINHSGQPGEVYVDAFDGAGTVFGPLTLSIGANETRHFNSEDLENGNAAKELSGGVGRGQGDWRLGLNSDLDIEVLSYIRTNDGFLTSMHDVAPAEDGVHRVAIFNPAGNVNQLSLLRLVNPGDGDAAVTIGGVDDDGASPGTDVEVSVPAGAVLTLSAADLESGAGVDGALGDGAGKWSLTVSSDVPIRAMSLLESPGGHLTNLSTVPVAEGGVHSVPLFPAASDELGRQGFVRVINRGDTEAEVEIVAFDETDRDYGSLALAVGANKTMHFNSDDLELGNAGKGLSGSTGAGEGVWRLELTSEADIEVLAYVRTTDGFLTSMHDVVPGVENRHRVLIFNPGKNANQLSRLRLINAGDEPAQVTIAGIDDEGRSPGEEVRTSIPAGGARTFTAAELESGTEGLEGALGTGAGKWRLIVESDEPITVVNLLESPTGHLTNLSTSPGRKAGEEGAEPEAD